MSEQQPEALRLADVLDKSVLAVCAEAAAELRRLHEENSKLRTVMIAAAEEIAEHWDAHCDSEGYGPANLMHRLERGIATEYGYTAGAFARLHAINAQLLEALARAERDGYWSVDTVKASDALNQALEQQEQPDSKDCDGQCGNDAYCDACPKREQPERVRRTWWGEETEYRYTPQPEPAAWRAEASYWTRYESIPVEWRKYAVPLYTHPPRREWVGLTDEEINTLGKRMFGFTYDAGADGAFARAIEAALKARNA